VDEFWVCQHCKSLNRLGTGKCYGCKNKYGSKPKEVETLHMGGPAPTQLPSFAPAPPGGVSGVVSGVVPPPAPYLARPPVTLSPIRTPAKNIPDREPRGPHPIAAIRKRVAWSLALRQSVPVAWLGYLTALLLTLTLLGGAMLVLNLTPAAGHLLQNMNASAAWGQLSAGQQGAAQTLGLEIAGLIVITLVCFSVFLGLSTHNAAGLGADQPLLTPYRAGLSLASVLWAQARIAVGLIVPAMIIWKGYTIPGLIAAIVAVEIAQRHMDDPFGWLTRPATHLPDLYAKLGIEGSITSPLASLWSIIFRIVNLMIIAVAALPAVGLVVYTASTLSGRPETIGWQAGGVGPAQLVIAILVGCLAGLAFGSLAMLVPITLGLVQRQRTRKTLVRVGRSRSWVARPGEGGYATAGPLVNGLGNDDPEDRLVERLPRYASPDLPVQTPGFGGRDSANPAGQAPFAGPSTGSSGFGGPPPQNPAFGYPTPPNFSGPFGSPATSQNLRPFGPSPASVPPPFAGPNPRGPFGGLGQNPAPSGPNNGPAFERPQPAPPIPGPDPDDSELIG